MSSDLALITTTPQHDRQLRDRLEGLTLHDQDYWSFKGNSDREHGHGLFQYPAMMVPQVPRAVLEQVCKVHPEIERVGDPFAGSGTILTESMLRGLCFSGVDVNPLAILLCRVKAGPFFVDALKEKVEEAKARIGADGRTEIEAHFTNIDKWFRSDVQIALSRIRRAILLEDSQWARRFLWVGLAEAVRLSSNSRTSTFKLHVRPFEEIEARNRDPIAIFNRAIDRNLEYLTEQAACLRDAGYLNRGYYRKAIDVTLCDTRRAGCSELSDVILTSPPYGDNASTVPYGQYSYLPLQWVNLADIDLELGADCLRSTHEIDTRSLGGSKRIEEADRESLADRSPAFRRYLDYLKDQPSDRANRVTAFFRDLEACLDPILRGLRPGGLMVWTLGNRKVGGKRVPLDMVLSELLASHRTSVLCKLSRRIFSKRMAPKNNIADTISTETILVMRKAV